MIEIIKVYTILDAVDQASIRRQMKELKLSLNNLSDMLEVTPAYLSAVFKGKKYFTSKLKSQLEDVGIVIDTCITFTNVVK